MNTPGRSAGVGSRGDLTPARLADLREYTDPLRLLVCEPDVAAREQLLAELERVNVRVTVAHDGAQCLYLAGRDEPELSVVAADIPVVPAPVVIRSLRQVMERPIVVSGGPGEAELVSLAIGAGASRFLGRPYRIHELRAIMLTLRSSVELDAVQLRAGLLAVNPLAFEVRVRDEVVPVTVRELEVLVYLMNHRDRVVTVNELQQALWPNDLSPKSNAVAVTVSHLRARLASRHTTEIIRTIRRRGYRFYPPEPSSNESGWLEQTV
jgi:two-component system alkaline phosphatase synthesis response regulator PhoP